MRGLSGTPRDPLFRYFNHNDPVEERLEVGSAGDPDCLFLGHTHVPCDIRSGLTHIINPGSIGQPRDDNPDAAYAVWENGQIHFNEVDTILRRSRSRSSQPAYINGMSGH